MIFPTKISPILNEPTPLGVPLIKISPSSKLRKVLASFIILSITFLGLIVVYVRKIKNYKNIGVIL